MLVNTVLIFLNVIIDAAAIASVIVATLWLVTTLERVLTNLKERR